MGSADLAISHLEDPGSAKETLDQEHDRDDAPSLVLGDLTPAPSDMNFQTWMALIAIVGQLNAYELALLIPATLVQTINADLGPDPSYPWINVSWTLGAAVLVSVAGRLADIFGRRPFMLFGAFVAFCGTIIGATGQNIPQMIASGVIMGVGSGFQEMGFACILEFCPNKRRLRYSVYYGTGAIVAFCSPLIAYAFVARTTIGWRGAYWFMTAWHGCAGIFLYIYYRPPSFDTKHSTDQKTKLQLLGELDYVGLALFAIGLTLFLVSINFGGRQYPWNSAPVVATMVIGLAILAVFGLWECYASLKYPLFPPKLFRKVRDFDVILGISFLCGMLYYSMQVLWPRQSAQLFIPANDAIIRGVYANLTSWGTWVAISSVWWFCANVHHEKWQLMGFIALQTSLIGSLSTIGVEDRAKAIALVFAVACVINQPLYMLFTMVSLGLEDQNDIGVAIGILSTFRLVGGTIATAMYTAILNNTFSSKLPAQIHQVAAATHFDGSNLDALLAAAKLNTPQAYAKVPGITTQIVAAAKQGVNMAYVDAYKSVYYAAIPFGICGLICALFARSTDMKKKNDFRAVHMENEAAPLPDCEK